MGRKINLQGTKVGADGTGYFRGDDGNYYYGNQQNGYLTETEHSAKQRARKDSGNGSATAASTGTAVSSSGSLFEACSSLLATVAGAAIAACVLISIIIMMICIFVIGAWPFYLGSFFYYLVNGIKSLELFIIPVVTVLVAVIFKNSISKVKATKEMQSKEFIKKCTIAVAIPYIVLDLLTFHIGIFEILENLFTGLLLSCLPAFILCYVEHQETKELRGDEQSFLEKISKMIAGAFIGHSTGLLVVGTVTVVVSVVIFLLGLASGMIEGVVALGLFACAIAAVGILEIVMGKLSKR